MTANFLRKMSLATSAATAKSFSERAVKRCNPAGIENADKDQGEIAPICGIRLPQNHGHSLRRLLAQ